RLTATPEFSTLSLHDALPIWLVPVIDRLPVNEARLLARRVDDPAVRVVDDRHPHLELWIDLERVVHVVEELQPLRAGVHDEVVRSEEHTSELQSLRHLVCRLL